MKTVKNLILLMLIIASAGCEEEFDPKSQFLERYSLNLIIQADTTTHIAILKRSYNVEGYDPYQNTVDPAVLNADIRLWRDDEVYTFKDSIIARYDTSRYNTPVHFYYLNDFSPVPGEVLQIKVELNNGKKLTASTKVPLDIDVNYGSNIIIPSETDKSAIGWSSRESGNYYVSRLKIYYKKNDGVKDLFLTKNIPLDYKTVKNETVPVYALVSKTQMCSFKNDDLTKAMREISEGDENKSRYTVLGGSVEVLVLDNNLSTYYTSTHANIDELSVNLDQSDFSNIQGGYGLFASYIKNRINLVFLPAYVTTFGYSTLP